MLSVVLLVCSWPACITLPQSWQCIAYVVISHSSPFQANGLSSGSFAPFACMVCHVAFLWPCGYRLWCVFWGSFGTRVLILNRWNTSVMVSIILPYGVVGTLVKICSNEKMLYVVYNKCILSYSQIYCSKNIICLQSQKPVTSNHRAFFFHVFVVPAVIVDHYNRYLYHTR